MLLSEELELVDGFAVLVLEPEDCGADVDLVAVDDEDEEEDVEDDVEFEFDVVDRFAMPPEPGSPKPVDRVSRCS